MTSNAVDPRNRSHAHPGLAEVEARIAEAARAARRGRGDITLIAVSKTFDSNDIIPVLKAGQIDYGENRVQEAKAKWPELKKQFSRAKLHLIGPLQTNKAAEAVALFDAIHTVDRPKLAKVLAEELRQQHRNLKLFIQINTGEEPQKSGARPDEADEFIDYCQSKLLLPITGLMCLPPINEEPALHFALLAKIATRNGIADLSMGMSSDLEKAIAFGATHIRVGTAIFGTRPGQL